jgi:3-dehydroquinate synthase
VQWVLIPTTLLAQADSCIGSKTSVTFGASKNLIGTFYPPDRIYIDTDFCRTLTREYFNSGLGEIIKFHLMSDGAGYRSLMRYLAAPDLRDGARLRQIIRSTLMIKRSYFEGDEFDAGRRNLLNYGHCFGHALESASGFAVCHGEAVIVGMDFANLVSRTRGIMKRDTCEEFGKIMTRYYPAFDLAALSAEDIIRHMRRDKKRVGKDLTMILSRGIGEQFKYNDIKEDEIRKAYAELVKIRRTCPLRRGSKER